MKRSMLDQLARDERFVRLWSPDHASPRFRAVVRVNGNQLAFAGHTAEVAARHALIALRNEKAGAA